MQTTRILSVADPDSLGRFRASASASSPASLDHWDVDPLAPGLAAVRTAADCIRNTDVPVGFPTETVYGLGADATRSAAVRGIFSVKGRPADNPLIVHVCDLAMLGGLLGGSGGGGSGDEDDRNPLPAIYRPLVARFWPGPLTLLLPVPPAAAAPRWTLAPEVTAGLQTFGVRLPASALARTLIRLADAPLAAPSANASTRPSPTTAQHVVDDLAGRIAVVLDGGASGVGVESTVVDGLCDPPAVLRPGGVSLAELRTVPGWERVQRAYPEDKTGGGTAAAPAAAKDVAAPRAPGMKYKHYSPKARVVLYEGTAGQDSSPVQAVRSVLAGEGKQDLQQQIKTVGVIRTRTWPPLRGTSLVRPAAAADGAEPPLPRASPQSGATYHLETLGVVDSDAVVLELDLGRDVPSIAHGLFSALRDLDARGADVIVVEGIDDRGDDMAGAVMNRLRKAASEVR